MKNLLAITLLFFSFGAMAEDNYRCEFFRTCEDKELQIIYSVLGLELWGGVGSNDLLDKSWTKNRPDY